MTSTGDRINQNPGEATDLERWASLISGGALVLTGLRQGSLRGALTALAGGGLIYQGVTKHSTIQQAQEAIGMNKPIKVRIFMNRLFSSFRKIVVVFLVGFMFLLGQAFSYAPVAQADVTTPEGTYYKGTPDRQIEHRNDNQVRDAQNKLRDTAANVREKLNLNEETPRATKKFFESKRRDGAEIYDRNHESREGYYQNPPSKKLRDRT